MNAMKRGPQLREKKNLSMTGLLAATRDSFSSISSTINHRRISLADNLMSALAMFSLKSPSLLSFDEQVMDENVAANLRSLYGIEEVPCDTHMRKVLDEVNPSDLRPSYVTVFQAAQRGKLLERYDYMGGYLCLFDGTELFNSEDVHCKNCCEKHHKDGRVTYHHQVLGAVIAHPDCRQVLPLCPEPITKQDGTTKNDCERNALSRFLKDLKREHPRLKLTMCADALSANASVINELKSYGHDFILTVKPDGNRSLFEWVKGVTKVVKMTVGRNTYTFEYENDVPINDTPNAPKVNFLRCDWIELQGKNGKKESRGSCSWVTSHEITVENLYNLMRGGRARWKIENETYNTLKNQGYQFEHNFGHGKQYLHSVFALLMMLAFLIDQTVEASCGLFQKALSEMKSRRAFWERIRGFFSLYLIDTWEDVYTVMSDRKAFRGSGLPLNTS